MRDKLIANSELVIKQMQELTDFEFGYDEESVKYVDEFINNQIAQNDFDKNLINGLVNTLGSYLGECIIHCYSGKRENTEYGLGVTLEDGHNCYPFNKIRKHFENGSGDSIYPFFTTIPHLSEIANSEKQTVRPSKPWWQFWK